MPCAFHQAAQGRDGASAHLDTDASEAIIALMTNKTAPVVDIPEPPQDFDALGWIKQKFGYELTNEGLKPVLGFLLLWNLFEEKECNKHACIESIRTSVERRSKGLNLSPYNIYMKFIKRNYFQNPDISKDLTFFFQAAPTAAKDAKTEKPKTEQQQVTSAFGVPESEPDLCALLFLVRRVRNNLFHGEKTVPALSSPDQMKLFSSVNGLLATYLNDG